MIPLIIIFLYTFYVLANLINYRYRHKYFAAICGGKLMKFSFILIWVGCFFIIFTQHRAGCQHLLAECYNDALPKSWDLLKDIYRLFVFWWLCYFVYIFTTESLKILRK
jgi:hypothetical protein